MTDIAGTTKGHAGGAYLSSGDQPQCGGHSGNPGHRGRGGEDRRGPGHEGGQGGGLTHLRGGRVKARLTRMIGRSSGLSEEEPVGVEARMRSGDARPNGLRPAGHCAEQDGP